MTDSIETAVAAILTVLLGKPVSPGAALGKDTEPAWDSIKHIEILLAIEENLDVSFEPEDIPLLTSMDKIIAKIRELHAG